MLRPPLNPKSRIILPSSPPGHEIHLDPAYVAGEKIPIATLRPPARTKVPFWGGISTTRISWGYHVDSRYFTVPDELLMSMPRGREGGINLRWEKRAIRAQIVAARNASSPTSRFTGTYATYDRRLLKMLYPSELESLMPEGRFLSSLTPRSRCEDGQLLSRADEAERDGIPLPEDPSCVSRPTSHRNYEDMSRVPHSQRNRIFTAMAGRRPWVFPTWPRSRVEGLYLDDEWPCILSIARDAPREILASSHGG
ncbi:uncharacterized protein ARMOST_02659 [Armillaria ostoyae]|uniref:Uncharacterized protein n=1 Tax=Armillaria ostoyae TaxID=47428 RepID=A0A284QSB2_ARMOS|nr:uncharacterized protein ARMOST_02659 [Armillaria ostoyae]